MHEQLQFQVSTGPEDEMCGTVTQTPAEETTLIACPLCYKHKSWSSFYCETCIRNGDLHHSSAIGIYEDDYCKKVTDLLRIQDRLNALNSSCEQCLAKSVQFKAIRDQINKKRFRVECLRAIVEEKRKEVTRMKIESSELVQRTRDLHRTIPRYQCKVQEMEEYVLNKKNHLGQKLTERTMLEQNVRAVARESIKKLIRYIFPIERVSNSETPCPSTAKELAEATRTAFVEGHWILQDSGSGTNTSTAPTTPTSSSSVTNGKAEFVIVAPSLPSDGNYKAYGEWFLKNRDTLPNTPTVDKDVKINENAAFRTLGALTHTAHLIQVLGFYLDIRFPFKVTAADFCTGFLSDSKFYKRVTRLNANIVHLLYTQGIKLNDVQPSQTLKNVALLLEVVERGEDRVHKYVDPGNVNFTRIDEHFSPILLTDSCTDTDEDDETSLQTEWESLEIVSAPVQQPLPQPPAVQQPNPLQTASMTIASIFRGLTGTGR